MAEIVGTAAFEQNSSGTGLPGAHELVGSFKTFLTNLAPTEYDLTHRLRFVETFQRMASVLKSGQTVLELGGLSRIAEFLRDGCGLAVSEYAKDLRDPFELPDRTFDMLLMLEVLEHLNDYHSPDSSIGEIAMFTASGVKRCLAEAFRVLQPGGCIILTTPNAVAVDALGRLLLNNHPFQYPPHVREYAPKDVIALAEGAGFTVEAYSTFFAWSADHGYSRELLLQTIGSLGYDTSNRGDDAYFILRRPPQTPG